MPTLASRHERFCQQFVHCGNAAKAARAAGYAPKTAKQQGYRLLQAQRIQFRIQEILNGLAEECALSTYILVGKLEMVYRRAMDDARYHAAARAVHLQYEFLNPVRPVWAWRDALRTAAHNVAEAERDKAEAVAARDKAEAAAKREKAKAAAARKKAAAAPPDAANASAAVAPPAPPVAVAARLRAVGG
jgi:hypothetical protein